MADIDKWKWLDWHAVPWLTRSNTQFEKTSTHTDGPLFLSRDKLPCRSVCHSRAFVYLPSALHPIDSDCSSSHLLVSSSK